MIPYDADKDTAVFQRLFMIFRHVRESAMRHIIYRSIADPQFEANDLFRLVYRSRMMNGQAGLSGFLVFSEGRFLQLLEGEEVALGETFARIRRDQRHRDIEVLSDRAIRTKLLGEWSMRRIPAGDQRALRSHLRAMLPGPVPDYLDRPLARFFADCPGTGAREKRARRDRPA